MRHFSSGQGVDGRDCRGRWGTGGDGGELTIEDGRERVRTAGDCKSDFS